MSSSSWVLPDELRQLAEADEGLVQEVLTVFRTDTTERMTKLRAALERDDRATVKHQAHAMKGSSGQVGAMEFAAICRQLETEALSASRDALMGLTVRAEAALGEVLLQMQE